MSGENMPDVSQKMSRRDFVGWVIRGGILMTLGGMIAPAMRYLWPVMSRGPSQEMQEVARLEEVPEGGSKKVIVAGSAVLLVNKAKEIKAFSAICTHLGCIVDWNGAQREILCPCHAGVFDMEGRVVAGPPPRPLPSYSVKISDGKIFVKI